MNGCLPLSANTLAEAEGGSGAAAALRHGFPAGAGSAPALPALLCDVVVMACAHTGEGLYFFSSLRTRACAAVDFLARKKVLQSELCIEHLISAAVAFVVASLIHPLCRSVPPVPSVIVNFFNLVM